MSSEWVEVHTPPQAKRQGIVRGGGGTAERSGSSGHCYRAATTTNPFAAGVGAGAGVLVYDDGGQLLTVAALGGASRGGGAVDESAERCREGLHALICACVVFDEARSVSLSSNGAEADGLTEGELFRHSRMGRSTSTRCTRLIILPAYCVSYCS